MSCACDGLSSGCPSAIPQDPQLPQLPQLSQRIGFFSLTEMDEVASTNDVVKAAIDEGAPEGFAVRASVQSGGYGRHGRHWASPAGGLYLSVLLRPARTRAGDMQTGRTQLHILDERLQAAKLPTLSLVVGLAVRRALASFLPPQVAAALKVKWPNDLVVESMCAAEGNGSKAPMFRKICGISLEQHAGAICVGIGVNVFPPNPEDTQGQRPSSPEDPQATLRNEPVYLADLVKGQSHIALSEVAQRILTELTALYEKWLIEPFSVFVSEYRDHNILEGRTVRIERNDGSTEAAGIVVGVDEWGRLLVESSETHEHFPVSSGEAHVIM